jgi:hypothetical protein
MILLAYYFPQKQRARRPKHWFWVGTSEPFYWFEVCDRR